MPTTTAVHCATIVVLLASGSALAQDAVREWTLVEDVRIGSLDGADALTPFRGLAVDAGGRMFVPQQMEGIVRVFEPDGSPSAVLGRRGGGPGEFELPALLGWLADTLWVLDVQVRRLSFWHHGIFVSTLTVPAVDFGAAAGFPFPAALLPDGTLVVHGSHRRVPNETGPQRLRVARVGRHGNILNEIATVTSRNSPTIEIPGGRVTLSYQPLDDGSLFRAAPDGGSLVLVDRPAPSSGSATSFSVTRIGIAGDTIYRRRFPYRPVRVTAAVTDRILQVPLTGIEERFPSPRAAREALRQALYLPGFHPPVTEMIVGRDHSVWLRREDRRTGTVTWFVLDRTGEPIARLELPADLVVHLADADHVWASVRDEWDIPNLVRFRVVPRT